MAEKIINIILVLVIVAVLFMDGIVAYDLFSDETDIVYEIGILILSLFIFYTIRIYYKQRKQRKYTTPNTRF